MRSSIHQPVKIKIKEIIAALTFTAVFRTLIGLIPAVLIAIPLFIFMGINQIYLFLFTV